MYLRDGRNVCRLCSCTAGVGPVSSGDVLCYTFSRHAGATGLRQYDGLARAVSSIINIDVGGHSVGVSSSSDRLNGNLRGDSRRTTIKKTLHVDSGLVPCEADWQKRFGYEIERARQYKRHARQSVISPEYARILILFLIKYL